MHLKEQEAEQVGVGSESTDASRCDEGEQLYSGSLYGGNIKRVT